MDAALWSQGAAGEQPRVMEHQVWLGWGAPRWKLMAGLWMWQGSLDFVHPAWGPTEGCCSTGVCFTEMARELSSSPGHVVAKGPHFLEGRGGHAEDTQKQPGPYSPYCGACLGLLVNTFRQYLPG